MFPSFKESKFWVKCENLESDSSPRQNWSRKSRKKKRPLLKNYDGHTYSDKSCILLKIFINCMVNFTNYSVISCSDPELKKMPCFEPFVWTKGSCNEGDYCRKNQPVLSELERECRVS
jgi:hypothetical protein